MIYETLENHFWHKPSVIVKRFKFHSRSPLEGEFVAEFVAGLRRLSKQHSRIYCAIDSFVDDRIERLLSAERELSFEEALEIRATATEMALKNLIDLGGKMHNDDNKVNKVDEEAKSPNYTVKTTIPRAVN